MSRVTQDPHISGAYYNELEFVVAQHLRKRVHTALPVRVEAVFKATDNVENHIGGMVDVRPQIDQIDNDNQRIAWGDILHRLPYLRLQGGGAEIRVTPKVGDIGLAIFAERDISNFKASRTSSLPGSYRTFSMSDGFYLGGFLNDNAEVFIEVNDETGVEVEASTLPIKVHGASLSATIDGNADITVSGTATVNIAGSATVNAQSTTLNSPTNTINGNIEVNGNIGVNGGLWVRDDSEIHGGVRLLSWLDVQGRSTQSGGAIISGIVFESHRHGGVEPGDASTGGPQ